jgi:two-component system sensor histidine kinase BarA
MGLVLATFSGVLLLAHVTGRRLSGAIQEAAQAVQRIKGGDLSVRLEKTESSEIGTLQEGVNLAVEAIVHGRQELERALAEVRAEHAIALSRLQVQTRKAERANQAKSMFLARVSHEMRTPLYSIQGLAEQLLKTAQNPEEARRLDNILRASQTLYHTISDILDFTQLEGGKYQPVLKAFELWEEIETNTETIGLLAHEQGLYLDVIVGHGVPRTVVGDQKGFRTVVANLLSNAVKFTAQGGVCIRLDLESRHPERRAIIRLQVQDTGQGIPPDRLTTIFKPFEQLDEGLNRRYAGSGLGLSIVKNYCDAMAGSITVDSEPGKGSTFTVRLPFEIRGSSLGLAPDSDFSQLSALVIEERLSFCESIHSRLSSLGIKVIQYPTALPACLATAPPSRRAHLVVVRDLSLADSWVEITRRLGAWGQQVVSFETRHDSERFQTLRENGVAAVLWSGATRSAIAAALRTITTEHPGKLTASQASDSHEPAVKQGNLGGKQVLVVEDFAINREIMARQLSHHGLGVIEASDGDEAVARALQGGIDLILMDIQMPGKDGITAIREIREIPACARLPILGFTASADKPTNRKVIEAGADAVLTKPIGEEELIRAIHQILIARQTPESPHSPSILAKP